MSRKLVASLSTQAVALVTALGLAGVGQAQASKTPYPKMAPLAEYLMTDQAEIALARSAAPASISGDATIVVLKQHGYEPAVKGKNGFVCIVERSWMSPFDWPEFWNPKMRGPVCYNPPAVRTILPYRILRTKLLLSGLSKAQMVENVQTALDKSQLAPPEPGAMSYMMSKHAYLADRSGAWHSHVMFHIPKTDAATWGADLPGSPVLVDTDHTEVPEPQTIFMVPVGKWSDGTSAASPIVPSAPK